MATNEKDLLDLITSLLVLKLHDETEATVSSTIDYIANTMNCEQYKNKINNIIKSIK